MENKCTLIDKEKTTSSILKNIGYAAVTTGLISTLAPGIGILGVTSILYPTIGTTAYLYGKKNIKFLSESKLGQSTYEKIVYIKAVSDIINLVYLICTDRSGEEQQTEDSQTKQEPDKGEGQKEHSRQSISATPVQTKIQGKDSNTMQKRTGCTQKDVCQSSLPIFSAFGHPLPYSKSSYSQERENVMRELYKMMQGKHTSCPSWEYFCYLSRSEKDREKREGIKREGQFSPSASEIPVQTSSPEEENKDIREKTRHSPRNVCQNDRLMPSQFDYPSLFKQSFSGQGWEKSITKLYDKLQGEYMYCSSRNYFYYVFGGKGLPNGYRPEKNEFISWLSGKPSLQWLIIRLYKPEGKRQLPRGTWEKVEMCFLMDGVQIPSKTMKLETNHIAESHKEGIDTILSEIMREME